MDKENVSTEKKVWRRSVRDPNLDIQICAYRHAVWEHLDTWQRGALTDLATTGKSAEYLAGLKAHAKRLHIRVNVASSTKTFVVPSKASA